MKFMFCFIHLSMHISKLRLYWRKLFFTINFCKFKHEYAMFITQFTYSHNKLINLRCYFVLYLFWCIYSVIIKKGLIVIQLLASPPVVQKEETRATIVTILKSALTNFTDVKGVQSEVRFIDKKCTYLLCSQQFVVLFSPPSDFISYVNVINAKLFRWLTYQAKRIYYNGIRFFFFIICNLYNNCLSYCLYFLIVCFFMWLNLSFYVIIVDI
jgi:hypothetical protein